MDSGYGAPPGHDEEMMHVSYEQQQQQQAPASSYASLGPQQQYMQQEHVPAPSYASHVAAEPLPVSYAQPGANIASSSSALPMPAPAPQHHELSGFRYSSSAADGHDSDEDVSAHAHIGVEHIVPGEWKNPEEGDPLRAQFLEDLRDFHQRHGQRLVIPQMGFHYLDVFTLYHECIAQGGFDAVQASEGSWTKIWRKMRNFRTTITNASARLRKYYARLLLDYECEKFEPSRLRKVVQQAHISARRMALAAAQNASTGIIGAIPSSNCPQPTYDSKMPWKRIVLVAEFEDGSALTMQGELYNTPPAFILYHLLPQTGPVDDFGQLFFFELPDDMDPGIEFYPDSASDVLEVGEMAYWYEKPAVMVGYGQTGCSVADECRLLTPCNFLGRINAPVVELDRVRSAKRVTMRALTPLEIIESLTNTSATALDSAISAAIPQFIENPIRDQDAELLDLPPSIPRPAPPPPSPPTPPPPPPPPQAALPPVLALEPAGATPSRSRAAAISSSQKTASLLKEGESPVPSAAAPLAAAPAAASKAASVASSRKRTRGGKPEVGAESAAPVAVAAAAASSSSVAPVAAGVLEQQVSEGAEAAAPEAVDGRPSKRKTSAAALSAEKLEKEEKAAAMRAEATVAALTAYAAAPESAPILTAAQRAGPRAPERFAPFTQLEPPPDKPNACKLVLQYKYVGQDDSELNKIVRYIPTNTFGAGDIIRFLSQDRVYIQNLLAVRVFDSGSSDLDSGWVLMTDRYKCTDPELRDGGVVRIRLQLKPLSSI